MVCWTFLPSPIDRHVALSWWPQILFGIPFAVVAVVWVCKWKHSVCVSSRVPTVILLVPAALSVCEALQTCGCAHSLLVGSLSAGAACVVSLLLVRFRLLVWGAVLFCFGMWAAMEIFGRALTCPTDMLLTTGWGYGIAGILSLITATSAPPAPIFRKSLRLEKIPEE